MTTAFVHIIVDQGALYHAAEEIATLDAVSNVHVVTGEFDIIVQLELDDIAKLPDVVGNEIHPISGVIETMTSVAFPV